MERGGGQKRGGAERRWTKRRRKESRLGITLKTLVPGRPKELTKLNPGKFCESTSAFSHLELSWVGAGRPRLLRGQGALFPLAGQHLCLLGLGRLRVDSLEELRTETDAVRVSGGSRDLQRLPVPL